jgi:hypothetical protein
VAADIIREHDAGVVVAPGDVAGTKAALMQMLELHRSRRLLQLRKGDIARYSREKIAGEVAGVITLLLKKD